VRPCRSILSLVLFLPLFCGTGLPAAVNGGFGDDGPFRVLPELAPGVPSFISNKAFDAAVGEDRYLPLKRFDELPAGSAGQGEDGKGRTFMQHLSFTFSRAATRDIGIDPSRRGEEERAWEKFRSLSSSLQTESYRDSLEAMGKIFQPQVNLHIEF